MARSTKLVIMNIGLVTFLILLVHVDFIPPQANNLCHNMKLNVTIMTSFMPWEGSTEVRCNNAIILAMGGLLKQ